MKRVILVVMMIGMVLGGGIIGFVSYSGGKDREPSGAAHVASTRSFADNKRDIRLAYPAILQQSELSSADEHDGILLRLTDERPPILITVRYETGLRTAATATKQPVLDLLIATIERAYPDRYPGYKQVHMQRLQQSGRSAVDITFVYQGPAGELAKQRLMIIIRDNDSAMYVAAQARDADFAVVNARVFTPLFASVRF